jgi:hypothetical protein
MADGIVDALKKRWAAKRAASGQSAVDNSSPGHKINGLRGFALRRPAASYAMLQP